MYTHAEIKSLQKKARKDKTTVRALGFCCPFLAYLLVDEGTWAVINVLTLNYLLLGFVLVPLHLEKMVQEARDELAKKDISY